MIRYMIYAAIALGVAWFLTKDLAGPGEFDLSDVAPAHAEKSAYLANEAAILACFDILNPQAQKYAYRDWVNRNKTALEELEQMLSVELETAKPSVKRFILSERRKYTRPPTFKSAVMKSSGELPSWSEPAHPSQVDSRALSVLGGALDQASCQTLSLNIRRGNLDISVPVEEVGN
ncbi:MAG: hypothetical protein AAF996_09655 [Pseudomonadota bacterium]